MIERPSRPRVRAAALFAAVAWLLVVPAPAGSAPAGTATFRSAGEGGGGFINVIAVDPGGSGVALAGGDVSGIYRSPDMGGNWRPVNAGATDPSQLKVASIVFSPTVPGKVYAAAGDAGVPGGTGAFLESTDYGATWQTRSTSVRFSGGNNAAGFLPRKQPRSTGNLIVSDDARGLVYVATFDQGVLRSSDDGSTWTSLGLAGKYLRSLVLDPTDPDVLYAASYGSGVFKTAAASGGGGFVRSAGSPTKVEELLMIGPDLYAASGPAGLYHSGDGGLTWQQMGPGNVPLGPSWISIAGYRLCGRNVLFAGATNGGSNPVLRSQDGGATWDPLTADPAGIHPEVGGPAGGGWWEWRNQPFMLGARYFSASQIAVDPTDPSTGCLRATILVAGRSGVWRTIDGGANWYPAVAGLGGTVMRGAAFNPAQPGRVYLALADWIHLYSTDGGDSFIQDRPRGGSLGLDVYSSASSSRVYLATGNPGSNSNGEIYSSVDPSTSGWLDEGLSSAAQGARPLAVASSRVAGEGRVIVAAVENSGIWRKSGTVWTRVNRAAMPVQTTETASLLWTGSLLYLYDHETGVWRSRDDGKSWERIWSKPSPTFIGGFLAVDPFEPGRLYVSVGGAGVFRLDGAGTGRVGAGTIVPVQLGAFDHPGPVAVDAAGNLYACELAVGHGADLLRSDDMGLTWTSVADDAYRAAAAYPYDLSVAPDGELFVSLYGNGLLRGTPP